MSLYDVADRNALLRRGGQVEVHVALRIDHHGLTLRSQQIRSVREASQIKLLEVHRTDPPKMPTDARTIWMAMSRKRYRKRYRKTYDGSGVMNSKPKQNP